MDIGLELRFVEPGISGGIVPHLRGVLNVLAARSPEHRFRVYGTERNRDLLDRSAGNLIVEALPSEGAWAALQRALDRDGVDVLFRGYPAVDDLRFPRARQIFFVPDLQHEDLPQLFAPRVLADRRVAFGRALDGAGAVGTGSAHAEAAIRALAGSRAVDVFRMPPAVPQHFAALEPGAAKVGRYFLYPANLWPHKNHRLVLQAFERFHVRHCAGFTFICVGHPDGWDAIASEFGHLPVRHLGFVSDAEIVRLYRGATALAYFSLYEGFGMPLLEAFATDCPVLCSDRTSLPEIGGDAVLACDPEDVEAMAALFERIAFDPELRRTLAARGRLRMADYAWARSADALRDAIERVHRRTAHTAGRDAWEAIVPLPS